MAPQGVEPRIWLIAGPTASGKSVLALRLAQAVSGEVINADSMQLYCDLRILTARPTPEEEAAAPHHLFGVADAAERWSVGEWLRAAQGVLAEIAGRGRAAIFVGGTGLYFRALTEGLADIPPIPEAIAREVSDAFVRVGRAAMRERLRKLDPAAAERIDPGDRQRMSRALEVALATGRSLSQWQAETPPGLAEAWRAVVIEPPRDALYRRCDARLARMIEAGALEEVRALMARRLDGRLPAMNALGVHDLAEHLAGRTTLEAALAGAQGATRRYAKRQLTWFRHQTPNWPRITAIDPEEQWRQFLALNPSLTGRAENGITQSDVSEQD
ncbi:MAG: tRNA (adenosine(37)-N6)-dimethylallyltransferase MiaA [Caulobacterales bacterium]